MKRTASPHTPDNLIFEEMLDKGRWQIYAEPSEGETVRFKHLETGLWHEGKYSFTLRLIAVNGHVLIYNPNHPSVQNAQKQLKNIKTIILGW